MAAGMGIALLAGGPLLADDTELPLISHLVELRDRLLRIVLVVAIVFVVLIPFSNTLFNCTLYCKPKVATFILYSK